MLKALSTYWHFLKSPQLIKFNENKRQLWVDFTSLLLIDLIFLAAISITYYSLLKLNWIKEYEGIDLIEKYGLQGTLFIACIFVLYTVVLIMWIVRNEKLFIFEKF